MRSGCLSAVNQNSATRSTGTETIMSSTGIHEPVSDPAPAGGSVLSLSQEYDRRLVRKTKVCHVSVGLRTGGLERLLVDFARFHDANRFELMFLALDEIGRPAEEYLGSGMRRGGASGFRKIVETISGDAVVVCGTEYRRRPHAQLAHPHFWGTGAAWLAGVPVTINTRHGQRFGQSLSGRLKFRLASDLRRGW